MPDASQGERNTRRKEVAAAAVLIAFGGGVIALARTIEPGVYTDAMGPRAFPTALGAGILLCGVLLAAAALLFRGQPGSPSPLPEDGPEGEAETGPFSPARLLGAVVVTAAYLAAFEPIGYLLATPGYVAALLLIHGGTSWRALWLAPPLITLVFYVTFRFGLLIPVPGGILQGMLP